MTEMQQGQEWVEWREAAPFIKCGICNGEVTPSRKFCRYRCNRCGLPVRYDWALLRASLEAYAAWMTEANSELHENNNQEGKLQ